MSGAGRPLYCQTTAITGMLISGRMSTGVRIAAKGPISTISTAMTMNVSGRESATRTSANIEGSATLGVELTASLRRNIDR